MGKTLINIGIKTFWNKDILNQNTNINVEDTNKEVYQKACEVAGKIARLESKIEICNILYPSLSPRRINYLP